MKKAIVLLLLFVCCPAPAFSDTMPENHHLARRNVYITNLDQYPDVTLVAYTTGPLMSGYEVKTLNVDDMQFNRYRLITEGYKFNKLRLFAIQTSVLDSAGGIDNIDFSKLADVIEPAEIIDPGTFPVPNTSKLTDDSYYYKINKTDSALILDLCKRTFTYMGNPFPVIVENNPQCMKFNSSNP